MLERQLAEAKRVLEVLHGTMPPLGGAERRVVRRRCMGHWRAQCRLCMGHWRAQFRSRGCAVAGSPLTT